jgi:hypothetical protein
MDLENKTENIPSQIGTCLLKLPSTDRISIVDEDVFSEKVQQSGRGK